MIGLEAKGLLAQQGLLIRGNKDNKPSLIQILKFSAKQCTELESS